MTEQGKENVRGIYFKVTDHERELIEQKMALAGVQNMSAYIRKMCIDGYTVNLQIPELAECARLLRRISANINQIARSLNSSGRYYQSEISEIKAGQEKTNRLFGVIIEQLSKIK